MAALTCFSPLPAYRTPDGVVFSELRRHDIVGSIDLACGQCIGCRIRRARDWSLRVMHEAQTTAPRNSFVTLTYDDDHLPAGNSLDYRHFQLFMKRLRRKHQAAGLVPPRFYMCGEYGDLTERPHYHACLFGASFDDQTAEGRSDSGELLYQSATLRALWPHGHHSVQALNKATADYTARYVTQKLTGQAGELHYGSRVPPFNRMSLRPAIGARWLERYGHSDIFAHDYVVRDGHIAGRPPRFYDRYLKRIDQLKLEEHQFAREQFARERTADNTPARLQAKAQVEAARLAFYKRELA